jgi:hypothetical protein
MAASSEKRLLALLRRLPPEQLEHLLDYAEFLSQRHGLPEEIPEPIHTPRPREETVVQAVKRLCVSYPMVDRSVLFNETSILMAQHTMEGRAALEIIDELELLFSRHYQVLVDLRKQADSE